MSFRTVRDPITCPSKQNPKRGSTKGACYRKAVFDDGGDLRLRVVAK
jgi:hypothetical protein